MMTEIPEGKYTLSFKVWDFIGITQPVKHSIFQVVKGMTQPAIFSVINIHNPASSYTYFRNEAYARKPKDRYLLLIF